MSLLAGRIINGLLLFFNIAVNVFYAFCLIFPPQTGQRKLPLTTLLGFLILCSLLYCVPFVIQGIYDILFNEYAFILSYLIEYTVDYSMVSYVWLNFYYYIQIVPAQSAFFHWVKRNIKSTIYVLLGIDILITLLSRITVNIFYAIIRSSPSSPFNTTVWQDLKQSHMISFYMIMVHYAVMLCVSVVSSLSTVCYLHKHIKNMGKMGTSTTRLRGQMRVTITGIFQGVLFFFYAVFLLLGNFSVEKLQFNIDIHIKYTLTSFFIFVTTVTLGIGQNVFRQKILDMYKAFKHVSIWQRKEMAS
ncbi:hypothetical protein NQD34_015763 [Periophthalmus magnuspinnatus]|nr:hypothetical protein NQD34_015763 [Periophthalmus magnuspinnatus]